MIINVENKSQFDELTKKGLVLVDFWAPWCGPCRMLAPNIEEVANENSSLTVLKVNCDENEELARLYSVSAIPTILLFKEGKLVNKSVGYMDSDGVRNFIK